MKKRKLVYISLPISGRDPEAVRRKSDSIKATLVRNGFEPVSPLDIYAGENPSYEDHICYDLRALLDCDILLRCEGWHLSTGCLIENYAVHEVNVKRITENSPQPVIAVVEESSLPTLLP